MNIRRAIGNLLALLLLLGGTGLLLLGLAGLFAPAAEPSGNGRMGEATVMAQALVGPITGTSTVDGATASVGQPLFTPTPWSLNANF
ncbi:MAG: hypothetical protein R3300_07130 [Candidatus Promineifilaceae bacterium]|nr:hypothetical protein [Candidatus Promineifilaceae bacterium]